MDSKKLVARLTVGRQVFGGNIECPRRVRFLLGDIDTANPRAVHAYVGHDVPSLIRYGDVHWLTDFGSLLFGRRRDPARVA
jgi:hypothetical protein